MANGKFNFSGKLKVNGSDSKYPSYRSGVTSNGNPYISLTLFISNAENNSGAVELYGQQQDELLFTLDNEKIKIPWDERRDKDNVEKIPNYMKYTVLIDDDRQDFLSSYDAIHFIWDNIDNIKGKAVRATGRIKKNEYNGNITDRFEIQNFYTIDESKFSLNTKEEIYLNKESFDFSNFKEDKKIYINAFTKEYMSKEHPNVYVPKVFIIDCSKVDFENEKNVQLLNGRWLPISLSYAKGKFSIGLKSNKMYSILVDTHYKNGAELEEFTEDMLTPLQKSQLELGIKTLEDFRPAGQTYGDRITEFRLFNCDIRGDYKNGAIQLDCSMSEFEEDIYQTGDDDIMPAPKEETKEKKTEEEVDFDEDDLFA